MKAIKKEYLPIYGKGQQKKPFIDLEDAVDSLFNSINLKKDKKFKIFNQFSESLSILQISKYIKSVSSVYGIDVFIKKIKNPRKEDETHQLKMRNNNFLKILKKSPKKIKDSIKDTIKHLIKN